MPKHVVISTRHLSVLGWLQKNHAELVLGAEFLPNVRPHQLGPDTTLIGSWPTHLLTKSGQYLTIEFEQRPNTAELTMQEMEDLGAHLKRYTLLDDEQLAELVRAAMSSATGDAPPVSPKQALDFGLQVVDQLRRAR